MFACTAIDAHGNAAAGHFAITVLALADTVPPVMTVSAPGVIEATGPGGAIATFTASAFDTVDGSVPVMCTPVSASMFPLGDTVVTCSATDAHNAALASSQCR